MRPNEKGDHYEITIGHPNMSSKSFIKLGDTLWERSPRPPSHDGLEPPTSLPPTTLSTALDGDALRRAQSESSTPILPQPRSDVNEEESGQSHLKNQSEIAYIFALTDAFLDSCFRRNDKKKQWNEIFRCYIASLYLSFPCFFDLVIPAKAGIQRTKSALIISNAFALEEQ
ncbi:MAG: hypothetical protein HQK97_05060 [Nitrospirae bacterium]|nr:hypothetical protein [Nitrospirota bacterium]